MLAGRPYLNCVDPLLKRPALEAGLSSPPRAEYAEPMQLELIVELEAILEDVVAVVEQGQATSRLVYELLGVSASFSFKLVRGLMHVEAEIVHARYGSPSQTNTGFGYVQFKQGELQSSLQYQDCSDAQEMEAGKEYGANFSVAGGPGGLIHSPLHESITLAALVSTGYNVASGTTLESASNADWEYIRGVVWNDDPACLLFNDYADANHTYSTAAMWTYYYTAGESEWKKDKSDKMQNPTGRSHYGDLQFLHCMASKLGEKPGETKTKVMKWLSVLWKLANGEEGITPDTVISKTDLAEFCPNFSLPANWGTLRYLLSGESAFEALDIPRRALGSMFHIIQDSYSLGHTRRTLLNPDAKISDDPLQFPSGVVDQWGPIENFHVYNGQDDHHHELYDHAFTPIPDPTNLANLDQFNSMIGCCDAVENCRGLIELKKAGKTWETGVKTYLDEVVFLLSKDATDADTRVWP